MTKRNMRYLLAASMFCALSACVSPPSGNVPPPPSPKVVAAAICPGLSEALITLSSPILAPGLGQNDYANLTKANDLVTAVCAAGSSLDVSNLQTLAKTGLPLILDALKVAGLGATDVQRITLAITLAQTTIGVLEAVQAEQAVQTTTGQSIITPNLMIAPPQPIIAPSQVPSSAQITTGTISTTNPTTVTPTK